MYCFSMLSKIQKVDLQRYMNSLSVGRCAVHKRLGYVLGIEALEDVEGESKGRAEEWQFLA